LNELFTITDCADNLELGTQHGNDNGSQVFMIFCDEHTQCVHSVTPLIPLPRAIWIAERQKSLAR
jgi:hypothetical protein